MAITLKDIKKQYKLSDDIYDYFLKTPEGRASWDEAMELYPEFNDGGSDMDYCADHIIDSMYQWISTDVPDKELDKLEKWFDSFRENLMESIFAGLT